MTQTIANNARRSYPFKLMQSKKTEFILSQVGKDLGKLRKLSKILYGDDTLHSFTTFDTEFNTFVLRYPYWNATEKYGHPLIFLTNYEHMNHLKIIRRQITDYSGGHMLAPITMQHYLMTINSHGNNTNSTNLGLLVPDMVHTHDILGVIDGSFKLPGNSWHFLSWLLGKSLDTGRTTLEGDQYMAWVNRPEGDKSPYPFNKIMKKAQDRPALITKYVERKIFRGGFW